MSPRTLPRGGLHQLIWKSHPASKDLHRLGESFEDSKRRLGKQEVQRSRLFGHRPRSCASHRAQRIARVSPLRTAIADAAGRLDVQLMKEDAISHLCVIQDFGPAEHFNVELDVAVPTEPA